MVYGLRFAEAGYLYMEDAKAELTMSMLSHILTNALEANVPESTIRGRAVDGQRVLGLSQPLAESYQQLVYLSLSPRPLAEQKWRKRDDV